MEFNELTAQVEKLSPEERWRLTNDLYGPVYRECVKLKNQLTYLGYSFTLSNELPPEYLSKEGRPWQTFPLPEFSLTGGPGSCRIGLQLDLRLWVELTLDKALALEAVEPLAEELPFAFFTADCYGRRDLPRTKSAVLTSGEKRFHLLFTPQPIGGYRLPEVLERLERAKLITK